MNIYSLFQIQNLYLPITSLNCLFNTFCFLYLQISDHQVHLSNSNLRYFFVQKFTPLTTYLLQQLIQTQHICHAQEYFHSQTNGHPFLIQILPPPFELDHKLYLVSKPLLSSFISDRNHLLPWPVARGPRLQRARLAHAAGPTRHHRTLHRARRAQASPSSTSSN